MGEKRGIRCASTLLVYATYWETSLRLSVYLLACIDCPSVRLSPQPPVLRPRFVQPQQQLGGGLPVLHYHTIGGAGGPRGQPGSFSDGTSAKPVGWLAVLPGLRLGGGRRPPG